jgi:hypothetical protein
MKEILRHDFLGKHYDFMQAYYKYFVSNERREPK